MGKSKSALPVSTRWAWRDRALGAVRPGVEAMLLAAVALGCAQAGWAVFSSQSAGASASPQGEDRAALPSLTDVRSPFSPLAEAAAEAQAAALAAASIQLAGVRVAADPGASGAVLTLDDGAQRAFAVGEEIAPGVTLAEVRPDSVLVSYESGCQELHLASGPPSFSFARAMLGEIAVPEAPAVAAAEPATAPQQQSASLSLTPADARALALALSSVAVERSDAQSGWRLPASVPAIVAAAGLQANDLVLSVNGAGPDAGAAALGALQSHNVTIAVRRGAAAPFTLTLNRAEPA
jgi:general secretion pathway protein C